MCRLTVALTPATVRSISSRNSSGASRRQQRLHATQPVVKAQVEVDALHLTVADQLSAGTQLVVDRQAHRVAHRLVAVVAAELLGVLGHVLAELRIPAGEGPTADHRR